MKTNHSRGFSLTEVMLAMAMGSVLSIGVYRIMRTQVQTTSTQTQASKQLRDVQRARFILRTDLAKSGFDPTYWQRGGSAFGPVLTAGNDQVTLVGDFNMSGALNDEADGEELETIEYLYDANLQTVTRNGTAFLVNLSSFDISYVSSSGTSDTSVPGTYLSSVDEIKRIQMKWTYAEDTSGEFEVSVSLPNYRD